MLRKTTEANPLSSRGTRFCSAKQRRQILSRPEGLDFAPQNNGGFIIFYEQIYAEHARLEKQIQKVRLQLQNFPPEKLICTRCGKYIKWYKSDGHTLSYIPKCNRDVAENLAVSTYLTLYLEDLLLEKKALSSYLKYHKHVTGKAEQLLNSSSEYQNLLSKYFKSYSQELLEWTVSPYPKNQNHPEHLIHKTISGNSVRSKSEALIDIALYTNKIPYRYECELILDELSIYPDFTIRHPKTGKLFLWEHFGLMDDPAYSKNAYSKLQLYSTHDFIPSINLITTFETKKKPLTSDSIERIIEQYFL